MRRRARGRRVLKLAAVVAVNSWTSGLVAAVGAIGLAPGDEVIVTPWTMVATATAVLHWTIGICDIDANTFGLIL